MQSKDRRRFLHTSWSNFFSSKARHQPQNDKIVTSILFATMLSAMMACKTNSDDNSDLKVAWIEGSPTGTRVHFSITPTGDEIFRSALNWYYYQPEHRAMPANCANNVSDVLVGVTSDFQKYRNELIPSIRKQVLGAKVALNNKIYQGKIINLPRNERELVKTLNMNFINGKIPSGALIAGCLNPDCSGKAGDGHIAIVGDLDAKGRVQVYHNNWFRPDGEGTKWREFMVSQEHLKRGIKRQWMPTPWMKFGFENDQLKSAQVILPEIDDLDPYNYYLSIYLIPEIVAELDQGQILDKLIVKNTSQRSSGSVCRTLNSDNSIPVYQDMGGKTIGTIRSGTVLVWMAEAESWAQVQVRIDGKLFGAGGDGTPKAYVESKYLDCK